MFDWLDTIDPMLMNWVLMPAFIFCARIGDVSLQTLRIVFTARGMRLATPITGFFEALVWLIAIRQILTHLDNVACFISYPAGFAAGTAMGMWIEHKLSLGILGLRVITREAATDLIDELRKRNFGVTVVDGDGAMGPVSLVFTIIKRKDLPAVARLIEENSPKAFYTIEDIRRVSEGVGVFPTKTPFSLSKYLHQQGFFQQRK
ncbi:DUF2179 domain-containing protein [bacterium]|nr:DUF2179 domain-containing protein [bacterium]